MQAVSHTVLLLASVACVLPFLLIILSSLTSEDEITRNGYSFFPKAISMESYQYLVLHGSMIARAYGITVFITIVGTLLNLTITTMLAYPLSRREFPARRAITFIVFFSLLFNGGLVPTYIFYTIFLGIKNTILALLVPHLLMSGFNVLIARTFFLSNIPDAIVESARMDGAGEFRIFSSIVVPCSVPIIATIGLFAGLGYWNDWMNGLIYLSDPGLYSIQNVLNNILMNIQFLQQGDQAQSVQIPAMTVRMAIAVTGMLPVVLIFPFFQKYYVKGLTIGAVKE